MANPLINVVNSNLRTGDHDGGTCRNGLRRKGGFADRS